MATLQPFARAGVLDPSLHAGGHYRHNCRTLSQPGSCASHVAVALREGQFLRRTATADGITGRGELPSSKATPIGFKSTQKGYARGVRKAAWLTLTSHDRNLQHQIAVPIVWFRGRTLRSSSKHELVLPVIVSISSLSMGQ